MSFFFLEKEKDQTVEIETFDEADPGVFLTFMRRDVMLLFERSFGTDVFCV